jgi:Mrp family chromosome partitioning ATPase
MRASTTRPSGDARPGRLGGGAAFVPVCRSIMDRSGASSTASAPAERVVPPVGPVTPVADEGGALHPHRRRRTRAVPSGIVRLPSSQDARAVLVVAALASVGAAAMLALAQTRTPGFVASVAWSAARSTEGGPGGGGESPFDVAAFRAWFAGGATVGDPFPHVRATVNESAAGVGLRLEARARTPWTAVRRAEDAAAAVEGWDRASAAARRAREIALLDARAAELATSIRTLQVGDATADGDALAAEVAERDAVVERRDALASIAIGSEASGALTRVAEVSWGVDPPLARAVAAAAATGAAMAIGARLLGDRPRRPTGTRRRGLRATPEVLATFPGAPRHTAEASKEAVVQLRARLFAATRGVATRVLVVTSSPEVPGKTAVACRLAEALALHGSRTLLVDGVLSAPTLADHYLGDRHQVDRAAGWEVASTLTWIEEPDGDHRVATIGVGGDIAFDLVPQARAIWLAPGTAESFYRSLPQVLERWDGYDAIVIDAPAVSANEDLRWIAAHATGVVLVVDPAAARDPGTVRRAQRATGAPLLGMVVSDPTPAAVARPNRTRVVA